MKKVLRPRAWSDRHVGHHCTSCIMCPILVSDSGPLGHPVYSLYLVNIFSRLGTITVCTFLLIWSSGVGGGERTVSGNSNLFSYNFTTQSIAYLHLHVQVWEFQKFGQEYPYRLMFLVSFS